MSNATAPLASACAGVAAFGAADAGLPSTEAALPVVAPLTAPFWTAMLHSAVCCGQQQRERSETDDSMEGLLEPSSPCHLLMLMLMHGQDRSYLLGHGWASRASEDRQQARLRLVQVLRRCGCPHAAEDEGPSQTPHEPVSGRAQGQAARAEACRQEFGFLPIASKGFP